MNNLTNLIKPNVELVVTLLKDFHPDAKDVITLNSSDVKRYRGTGYGCVIELTNGFTWSVSEDWDIVDGAWSI
ncbi:hypothetical protein MA9V2_044 [Chryseobacterium phage MA9V-2]|nr:hypothetical protein MA9V2_044 [Chryseobacterium phage MA9V-2]